MKISSGQNKKEQMKKRSVHPEIVDKESRVGGQGQQGSGLAGDMECNKVIKVIIRCNVQPGVVFSVIQNPKTVIKGGVQKLAELVPQAGLDQPKKPNWLDKLFSQ